jgi:hypothetical protein
MAPMKNSMGRGRFFMLTACTSPGIELLTGTVICMTTLTANEPIFPLLAGDEVQALTLICEDITDIIKVNSLEKIREGYFHASKFFAKIVKK